jgi:ABC-type molybdate transport system substrate-binding protein
LIAVRVQRRILAAAATGVLLVLALGFGLPGAAARAESDRRLRVLAAASLTEVALALAERFEKGEVVAVFGPTSTLARQLRDGAPGDVFLSASPEWMGSRIRVCPLANTLERRCASRPCSTPSLPFSLANGTCEPCCMPSSRGR